MIDLIVISNFQSHSRTIMRLDPGVNVIVGASDSGKSTILRALLWCVTNRPTGDSVHSWYGDRTRVDVTTSDGHKVSRIKGKSNKYIVDGHELEAFGHNVPQEVSNVLNISELNISRQLDGPFFLSLSPGDVAKQLNKVANLSDIDKTMTFLNSHSRQVQRDISTQKELLKQAKDSLSKYDYIPKLENELNEACVLWEKTKKNKELVKVLAATIGQIIDVDNHLQNYPDYSGASDQVESMIEENHKLVSKKNDMNRLYKTVHDVRELDKDILHLTDEIEDAEEEFKKHMPDVCPLCGRSSK